ncbi:phosphatase [Microbacterium phage TinyMiny]|nr:phosphatase [Microbacterium phage TinyMiny]
MRLHPLAPVVGLDVDGTLADYYEHMRWFAELYLQRPVTIDWTFANTAEFSDALQLDKKTYRDIKLAYRQGGMKRSIPVMDDRGTMVKAIRAAGIQVWITTTRPWQRLDNIDPDTQFWLNRNVGRVDGVIYGEEKYMDLLDIVGSDRILGIVDDLPENIVSAMSLGLRAALAVGDHNAAFRSVRKVPEVRSAADLGSIVFGWHQEYINRGASAYSAEDL